MQRVGDIPRPFAYILKPYFMGALLHFNFFFLGWVSYVIDIFMHFHFEKYSVVF